jgi:hypothetical protein
MITQNEFNTVLVEINKILEGLNKRITALEEQSSKPVAPKKPATPSKS